MKSDERKKEKPARQPVARRKPAAKVPRQASPMMATVLGSMSELVVYQDTESRVLWVNKAAADSVGLVPEQLVGRFCYAIWQQRNQPCEGCPVVKAHETGQPQQSEMTSPDGRMWLIRGTPVRDVNGNITSLIEVTQDITDRKRAEEVLQESEEKYRSLVERANDGICIIRDGIIEYLNPRLAKMWAGTVKEFIGTPFIEHLHPDNLRELADLYKRRVAGEDITPVYEITLIRKDGSKLDVEVNAGVISYKGKPADMVVIRDITERKKAEGELQEERRKLKEAQTMGKIGNWEYDVDSQRIIWSDEAYILYERDPALGPPTAEEEARYYSADQARALRDYAARSIEHGEEFKYDLEAILPSGKRAVFAASMRPIKNESGRVIKLFGTVQDITERKQAEEKMQHLNLVLRAIRNVNQLIARRADRDSLLKGACENFVSTRGYYNAWIALLDESGKLVTAAEAALGKSFLPMVERLKRGELPYCGRETLKKSGVVVIEDPASACADCPLAKGYTGRCGMSIRLEYGGKVYGLMTVSAPPGIAVEKEEQELFEEVAGDISFALYSMEQEKERKKVEEALRRSEQNFRDSLENSPLGIRVLDTEGGKTIYANRALLDIWGYNSVEELEAVPREQRYTPESCAEHVERLEKRKRGEHIPQNYEASIVRKDGQVRHVSTSTRALMWGGEKQFQVVYQDITDRKQAEAEYRTFVGASMDCFWLQDMQGNFLDVNEAYCRLTGYSRDELLNMAIKDVEAIEKPEEIAERIRRIEEVGYDHFETRHRRKDGGIVDVEVSVNYLSTGGGRLFVFLRDVTERKQVEGALQESEEMFRQLFNKANDMMFLVEITADGEPGRFIQVNDAACQKLGYSTDELLGMSRRDIATTEEWQRLVSTIVPRLLATSEITFESKFVRKDGHTIETEHNTRLMDWRGQRVALVVARDVAQRKRAEEERRQLEQKAQLASRLASVGEMAAGIAHEINNPLTSVIGYAQLLSSREDIPEDVGMDLKAIDEGAQRVAGIIKRLLVFARQTRPERMLVNINDLITNTLELRAYHLRTSNIKVTAKLAADLPITVADPSQLQQVFLNIVVNAETAMKLASGRGKLLVKTEAVNDTIRISFKDNGPGIAKKNLARIFDPFFTTREVGEGTGLGLSICHGIIAEHDGRIWAESKPGKGATFIVELPIVMESRQLEMAEPAGKEPQKVLKAKILVVDDEPSTLDFLSRLLTSEGHQVETVSNAAEALEMVKNRRYNLILLDIKMPGESGIELYGRMQKIALSLVNRVMFITGDVMGTDTEDFLSKTRVPYITKPFDVNQLKERINRFLTGVQ